MSDGTPGAQAWDDQSIIVDPRNDNHVFLDLEEVFETNNAGRTWTTTGPYWNFPLPCHNPDPLYQSNPCDPNPRFVAPFSADIHNINHWVAGGQYAWDNKGKGWNTNCSKTACDWKIVHDTGSGNQINAIADSGPVTYAGWCGGGCNPAGAVPFTSGIDTNFGGTWHTVTSKVLPNRVPTSFTIDPANSAHAVVTFGGFSRHWIPNAGRCPGPHHLAQRAKPGSSSPARTPEWPTPGGTSTTSSPLG